MATAKVQCAVCERKTNLYLCRDCSKDFCFDHLTQHAQKVNAQREKMQTEVNQFRQTLNDQKMNSEKQPLIQVIKQWEKDSIKKIQQTAAECRTSVLNYTNKIISQIEMTLGDLNEQPLTTSKTNKCDEIDSDQFSSRLQDLKQDLDKLQSNVSIKQQPTLFINRMFVTIRPDKGNIIRLSIRSRT